MIYGFKNPFEKALEFADESARLRKRSKALQGEHRRLMKILIENDKDLARLFKRLGIQNPHKSN